jgi:ABC-2 type transport system ATP-binding protein
MPQLRVLPDSDLIRHSGGEALVVRAAVLALDDLIVRLVGAGVAVRGLAPVVPPLEAAFLALTNTETEVSDDPTDGEHR